MILEIRLATTVQIKNRTHLIQARRSIFVFRTISREFQSKQKQNASATNNKCTCKTTTTTATKTTTKIAANADEK